jgi:hypothetical protein
MQGKNRRPPSLRHPSARARYCFSNTYVDVLPSRQMLVDVNDLPSSEIRGIHETWRLGIEISCDVDPGPIVHPNHHDFVDRFTGLPVSRLVELPVVVLRMISCFANEPSARVRSSA